MEDSSERAAEEGSLCKDGLTCNRCRLYRTNWTDRISDTDYDPISGGQAIRSHFPINANKLVHHLDKWTPMFWFFLHIKKELCNICQIYKDAQMIQNLT